MQQLRLTFLLFILPLWGVQAQTVQAQAPTLQAPTVQTQAVSDSIPFAKPPRDHKILKMTVPSAVLIGAGLYTMHDHGFYSSEDAKQTLRTDFPNFHTHVDNYLMFAPLVAAYGLNAFGIESKNNFTHKTGILVASAATMGIAVTSLKYATHVTRPNGEPYSFPSGHTAAAFMIATFLDHEFRDQSIWISVGGYTIATATGAMRMLNNKHWMTDVLAGAGVGILSTNMAYLVHDHYFKNVKTKVSIAPAMPYGKPGIGIYGSF